MPEYQTQQKSDSTEWMVIHRAVGETPVGFRDKRAIAVEVSQHISGKVSYCLGWTDPETDKFQPMRNIYHSRVSEVMAVLVTASQWAEQAGVAKKSTPAPVPVIMARR